MKKNYIAMLMNRHYLGDDTFIFNSISVMEGRIDEKSKIFKDRNGTEYFSIMDKSYLLSEISYAYSNLYLKDDMVKIFGKGNKSLGWAIRNYERLSKDLFYFVIKTSNGEVFCYPLSRNEVLKNVKQSLDKIDCSIKLHDVNKGKVSFNNLENHSDSITSLIESIVRGDYSLKDLEVIRDKVSSNYEDLEGLLDTIDLQIDATNNGEASVEMNKIDNLNLHSTNDSKVVSNKGKVADNSQIRNNTSIDVDDVFNKITRTLIAQDEPVRRMLIEIVRRDMDCRKRQDAILLTGATGVGKTELMGLIAKYLDRGYIKVDATQLTMPGYVGKNLEEVLWDLYVACDKNKEKCENAIIYFDEIDKKGSADKSDVSGKGVLNTLLPFITGSTYDACSSLKSAKEKVKIDTTNMIVVLGGAYTDVYKDLIDKSIGFSPLRGDLHTVREATTDDFIEKAMMTDEFMGRSVVIKMNDLEIASLKQVITKSDKSAWKVQRSLFERLGVELKSTDSYLEAIASEAYERKTGARGLNTVIDETTWRAFDDVYCNPNVYSEVILDGETVKDSRNYQLVKKNKR